MPLVAAWLAEATASIRNATAMTLATVEPDGQPSARMVICRGFDAQAGWVVFYTHRESAQGQALPAHPHASLVLHLDALQRQIPGDRPGTPAPDAQSHA